LAVEQLSQAGRHERLGSDSLARFASDGLGLVLGAAAAVITARWLGPAGKGVFAVLTFLGALSVRLAVSGLGDAAIVLVGRGRARIAQAIRSTLTMAVALGIVAAALFAAAAGLVVQPRDGETWAAIAILAATIPIGSCADACSHFLALRLRIVSSSAVALATATTSTLGLVVFLGVLDAGLAGAAVAVAGGSVFGLILAASLATREDRLGFGWDRGYLKLAMAYGARLELSHLATLMAGRVDLLLVFALAGEAQAGYYSVALTVATATSMAPFALSYATFPRLAVEAPDEARKMTVAVFRAGTGLSILAALALSAVSPFAVPLLFGSEFSDAVAPAVLSVVSGIFWGCQWALGRAAASRGNPQLLLRSFGLALIAMVLLDLIAIPLYESVGAAVASGVAGAIGLAVCVRHWSREGVDSRDLIPGRADLSPLSVVRRLRSAVSASGRGDSEVAALQSADSPASVSSEHVL